MEAYVYVSGPRDIAEQVQGSTELNPIVVGAADQNVALVFPAALQAHEVEALSDFMQTRGYSFVERRTVTGPSSTFTQRAGVSPDGSVYELQVSDAGALTARKVP